MVGHSLALLVFKWVLPLISLGKSRAAAPMVGQSSQKGEIACQSVPPLSGLVGQPSGWPILPCWLSLWPYQSRHYVGPSVGPSVGQSVFTSRFWAFRAKRRADFSYCPCPANILPLPTRTRLILMFISDAYNKICISLLQPIFKPSGPHLCIFHKLVHPTGPNLCFQYDTSLVSLEISGMTKDHQFFFFETPPRR